MRDPHCIQCGQYITHFGKGWKYSIVKVKGRYCHEQCYQDYKSRPRRKDTSRGEKDKRYYYKHREQILMKAKIKRKLNPPKKRIRKYESDNQRRRIYYWKHREKIIMRRKVLRDNMQLDKKNQRLENMRNYYKQNKHKWKEYRKKLKETDDVYKVKIL